MERTESSCRSDKAGPGQQALGSAISCGSPAQPIIYFEVPGLGTQYVFLSGFLTVPTTAACAIA